MQSKVVPRAFVLMTVLFYFKEEIMSYSVVWILFLGGCLFLMYFYSGKMRQVKKYQKQQRAAYEENRVKYSHFTSEVFDQTPDVMTPSELLIYTIYQVELSMEGGRGSLHSFFIKEPYCLYRPYAIKAFEAVDCHEIAELMTAAEKLAVMIENEEEIELDEDSDYGKYNFSDFTSSLLSMLKSSGIVNKAAKFIRENKHDFIDLEVTTDEQTTGTEV